MSRTEARVQALSALYAADTRSAAEPDVEGLSGRARRLTMGVWTHRGELDSAISAIASGWRIERMPSVDRNILRIGTYELRFSDLPIGVVVSEAVEMAKRYSTERSGAFVNGVLAKFAEEERGEVAPEEEP